LTNTINIKREEVPIVRIYSKRLICILDIILYKAAVSRIREIIVNLRSELQKGARHDFIYVSIIEGNTYLTSFRFTRFWDDDSCSAPIR
jgi:hypothetical protein